MKKILFTSLLTLFLTACGGSNNGNKTILTGSFKDSAVKGISYESGSILSGITDENGKFEYYEGDDISFSIGAIELGKVKANGLITPLDLSAETTPTTDTPDVINMARFLQMLDEDGDPSNGIIIGESVQNAAQNWQKPNFSVAADNFASDANLSNIQDDTNVFSSPPTLPSEADAKQHFESTLSCQRSSMKSGTISGGSLDGGVFAIGLRDEYHIGEVYGILKLGDFDPIRFSSSGPISFGQQGLFNVVLTYENISYEINGKYDSLSEVSGTYVNVNDSSDTGEFSGKSLMPDDNAKYRLTRRAWPTNPITDTEEMMAMTFDIYSNGNVKISEHNFATNVKRVFNGTISGSNIEADNGKFAASFDENNITLSITKIIGDEVSGDAFQGCRLN